MHVPNMAAASATIGDIVPLVLRSKQKQNLVIRYLANSDFAEESTIASVLRWIRDNPDDVSQRPSSQRVGLWSNERMQDVLSHLHELLTSEDVVRVVERDIPVSDEEYKQVISTVSTARDEYDKQHDTGKLVSIAAHSLIASEASMCEEEPKDDGALRGLAVPDDEEDFLVDSRVAARISDLENGLRNIRSHMIHFSEHFGDEKFFAVCTKIVMHEISKLDL